MEKWPLERHLRPKQFDFIFKFSMTVCRMLRQNLHVWLEQATSMKNLAATEASKLDLPKNAYGHLAAPHNGRTNAS